jgi:hypothetical protein
MDGVSLAFVAVLRHGVCSGNTHLQPARAAPAARRRVRQVHLQS